MQVTLVCYDKNGAALSKPLQGNERVIFGRGERANFQVTGDDIADAHFSIENDGRDVWVHRLADSMAPVFLNGQPVEKSEIDDGETVAAGNTKVRVQILDRERVATVPGQLAQQVPTSTAEPSPTIVDRHLPTGLVMYHDPNRQTPVGLVLDQLLTKLDPLLLANFQAAGEKPPETLSAKDLLNAAPAEIASQNSLHLISAADFIIGDGNLPPIEAPGLMRDKMLELFHKLRPRAAGILVFTKAPKDDVLKAISFRRGFYCSADGLEMFLRQGSQELAQGLVTKLSAILIARAGDADWSLYANPGLAPTPSDLGFNAPPKA